MIKPAKLHSLIRQFSTESRNIKKRVITSAVRSKVDVIMSQWKLKVKPLEPRENGSEQVVIGFSFAFDWFKRWREFLDQSHSK